MKIGILGGSFNPIHNGHLRIAIEVLEELSLDRVELVPAPYPPHKTPGEVLDFSKRYELVKRAVMGIEGLYVNPIESKREGPSYTVVTLREFRDIYKNDELFFIIGGDELFSLDKWYRWRELFHLCNMVVVGREEGDEDYVESFLKDYFEPQKIKAKEPVVWEVEGYSLFYLRIPKLEISSSSIREKVKMGRRIRGLVPIHIEDMIYTYYSSVL